MTTEERIVTLMASANPVPDEESLELDSVTVRLAVLTQGSEVTQLKKRTGENETTGRSLMPWLVAAAAVLVLGVVGFLTWPDNESPAAEDPIFKAHLETIQQLISTRDYPTLASLVTENWLTEHVKNGWYPGAPHPASRVGTPWSTGEEMMQNAWAIEDILGVERALVSCIPVGDIAANCAISYTNDIYKVMDEAPMVDQATFIFADDRIDDWFAWGEDPRQWGVDPEYIAAVGLQNEVRNVCPVDSLTPACAQFIVDNVYAAVAWRAANP